MLQPQMVPQQMQMPSPWVGMPAQMPQQMDPALLEQMQMQQMQSQNPMLAYMNPQEAAAKAESARTAFGYKPKPTPTPTPTPTPKPKYPGFENMIKRNVQKIKDR